MKKSESEKNEFQAKIDAVRKSGEFLLVGGEIVGFWKDSSSDNSGDPIWVRLLDLSDHFSTPHGDGQMFAAEIVEGVAKVASNADRSKNVTAVRGDVIAFFRTANFQQLDAHLGQEVIITPAGTKNVPNGVMRCYEMLIRPEKGRPQKVFSNSVMGQLSTNLLGEK